MILRVRDTRLMERRKIDSKPLDLERRKSENRKHDSRWSSDSHHILVIAIERQPGQPDLWKNEDVAFYAQPATVNDVFLP